MKLKISQMASIKKNGYLSSNNDFYEDSNAEGQIKINANLIF